MLSFRLLVQEAWWEDPKFLASVEEASGKKSDTLLEETETEEVDEKALEIEKIATEWAKREYFRQSMAGSVDEDMTEEAFIESVWERAMFEGDVKYRQMKGEDVDEAELLDFKASQERKQQAMLKKAKEELKELLEEEDLGGEDFEARLEGKDSVDKE